MPEDTESKPELFIMHLWRVFLPEGEMEWRGRLHHTNTKVTRNFRDWPALIPTLLAMLRETPAQAVQAVEQGPRTPAAETGQIEGEAP